MFLLVLGVHRWVQSGELITSPMAMELESPRRLIQWSFLIRALRLDIARNKGWILHPTYLGSRRLTEAVGMKKEQTLKKQQKQGGGGARL